MDNGRKTRIIAISIALLAALAAASFFVGSFPLPFKKFAAWAAGFYEMSDREKFILFEVRLPRVVMAVVTGAVLAAGGVSMQAVFKNPIVSPFVIGISSGAGLGAALGIVYFNSSPLMVEILAFVFALGAVFAAYALSGSGRDTTLLLLFGICVSSLSQSIIGLMQYFADADRELPALTFWMLGGLDSTTNGSLAYALPAAAACLGALYSMSYKMNLLALGDLEAASLGVDAARTKNAIIFLSALMVAACTSKTGVIGWIGLTTPHAARIILGADNRFVFPFAATLGAIFLLVSDDIVRFSGAGEVPVGIITAAAGAPIFGFLLIRYKKTGWS